MMEKEDDDSSRRPGMGFPFSPSDEELLNCCLKRIDAGEPNAVDFIPDIEVFKFEPWDLPGLSKQQLPLTKKRQKKKKKKKPPHRQWYFFSRINPEMTYCPTTEGYWNVNSWKKSYRWKNDASATGWKTTLTYHNGEHPNGERTNWEMHLYSLDDNTNSGLQTHIGLCKIIQNDYKKQIFQKPSPEAAKEGSDPVDVTLKNYPKQQGLNSITHLAETNNIDSENAGADSEEKVLLGQQALEKFDTSRKELLLLFGEDVLFEKDKIVQLWMALGCLDEPMEVVGANYFEKIVSEGYILPTSDKSLSYKVNVEKVNAEMDIVGDKQSYLILCNQSQKDDAFTKTLHVSVSSDAIDEAIFEKLDRFKSLRTLLFMSYCQLHYLPIDLFMRHESLVALDLSGTRVRDLPCSMGEMVHLRYLDVSWTGIMYLPETTNLLQELQTLKLRGCPHLRTLPREINKAIKLRHLDLDVIWELDTYPKGIGALVNLRTLSGFSVGGEEGHKISELKDMNNLMGGFCITKLERVRTAEEANEASLMAKRNLKKLELRWTHGYMQRPNSEDEAILENLRPCSGLEEIQILYYRGTTLPTWIADVSSFDKLVSITLLEFKNVSVLPSNLEKLPLLEFLHLDGFKSVIEMNYRGEGDQVAFPKLQILKICGMLNLETWTEPQEGDYPSLVELCIRHCPKLHKVPSLVYLPWALMYLDVCNCTKLAFVSGKQLSASLQELSVSDCPLIKESCSKDGHIIDQVPNIYIDGFIIKRSV